jgi:crotonobetainyl-CoA:carnitine CoA-transferase CaiB-like acyl-CoA transferase
MNRSHRLLPMSVERQLAPGPLDGVRVLDLTRVIVGPYCSQLLGDMGAEIIKVESPDGDLTRSVGPRRNPGMGANFMIFNRNKRSVVLDLKQEEGRDVLRNLAKTCDAFIVNYRPRALRKLQITYDDLREDNPQIVYCRIVGYGEDSQWASKPAIDDVIQSLSGLVSLQERLNGRAGYVGLPLADLTVGLMALSGVLAALYRRRETGEGEEIEVRMYDAMASFVLSPHLGGWSFDPPDGEPIYGRSVSPNRRPFQTLDGSICVAPYTDRAWHSFLSVIGRVELLEDPRFNNTHVRWKHLDELYQMMIPVLKEKTSAEWLQLLEQADVPCSPVQTTDDLVRDPSLVGDLLQEYEHPTEGTVRLLRNPVRFTQAPGGLRRLPPTLGADSASVLAELGYSSQDIERLAEAGVTQLDEAAKTSA